MKSVITALVFLLSAELAFAGRPLLVDDANVNATGAGHVEAWVEKSGGAKSFTVAPAYAVIDGLELAVSYSRDQPYTASIKGVSAKYQLNKPQQSGCHNAISVALAKTSGNRAVGANLIGSCALGFADAHMNLSVARDSGTHTTTRAIGAALEKDVGFAVAHVEAVGQQHAKPIFQVGMRKEIVKNWHLDGTVGRQAGQKIYSLGMKLQF